jgi:hypothetical protein
MNELHLIADWFDLLKIPPEKANCIWCLGGFEIGFDRRQITLEEYRRILSEGNAPFVQAPHNPENLVGYHSTEAGAVQVRVNRALEPKNPAALDPGFYDPDGVWTPPKRDSFTRPTPEEEE